MRQIGYALSLNVGFDAGDIVTPASDVAVSVNYTAATIDSPTETPEGFPGEVYLVGDWNGDGRDNVAIGRGNQIYVDYNFDDRHDRLLSYGHGNEEAEYLVGDWDAGQTSSQSETRCGRRGRGVGRIR